MLFFLPFCYLFLISAKREWSQFVLNSVYPSHLIGRVSHSLWCRQRRLRLLFSATTCHERVHVLGAHILVSHRIPSVAGKRKRDEASRPNELCIYYFGIHTIWHMLRRLDSCRLWGQRRIDRKNRQTRARIKAKKSAALSFLSFTLCLSIYLIFVENANTPILPTCFAFLFIENCHSIIALNHIIASRFARGFLSVHMFKPVHKVYFLVVQINQEPNIEDTFFLVNPCRKKRT